MSVVVKIKEAAVRSIESLYAVSLNPEQVLVNATKPEFEGHYTVVLFAFVKQLKKSPDALGQELGTHLLAKNPTLFSGFNVIKGFLNLVITNSFWLEFIDAQKQNQQFGIQPANGKKV
ncbi:MAG: arginine--tRNA ligase, partial [Chitinophagaceae bacterium]|nr:arginine--tRNA ligase [Chitinophagaceae bacterium]